MSNRPIIRVGYAFTKQFYLTLDGSAEDLSEASSIYAVLKNLGKTAEYIADTAQTQTADDDWATGNVGIRFSAAQTAAASAMITAIGQRATLRGWIEIAVNLYGVKLAYPDIPVDIEIGFALT